MCMLTLMPHRRLCESFSMSGRLGGQAVSAGDDSLGNILHVSICVREKEGLEKLPG